MFLFLLLQTAEPLPTIQLNARVEAREVRVERKGTATLSVRAEPDAGSRVVVNKRPQASGARVIRDFRAEIDARAVVADPQQSPASSPAPVAPGETPTPEGG